MGFSLSPNLSARVSNIGRGLIDRAMTKTPCYDLFIILDSSKKRSTESSLSTFFESAGNLLARLKTVSLTGNLGKTKGERAREIVIFDCLVKRGRHLMISALVNSYSITAPAEIFPGHPVL